MFVLVVGAGRVGSSVATSALRAGHTVSVLDEDPLSHERLDVELGSSWEESRHFESSAQYRGWAALEMARVDASMTTFVGVQSGLAMGAIYAMGWWTFDNVWLPGRIAMTLATLAMALPKAVLGRSDTVDTVAIHTQHPVEVGSSHAAGRLHH